MFGLRVIVVRLVVIVCYSTLIEKKLDHFFAPLRLMRPRNKRSKPRNKLFKSRVITFAPRDLDNARQSLLDDTFIHGASEDRDRGRHLPLGKNR